MNLISDRTLPHGLSCYIRVPQPQLIPTHQQSRPFGLHHGTYQGCPLSPMVIDLAIEPLATAFAVFAKHLMTLAFCLKGISQPSALSQLSRFVKFLGYKLNIYKSMLFTFNYIARALDLTIVGCLGTQSFQTSLVFSSKQMKIRVYRIILVRGPRNQIERKKSPFSKMTKIGIVIFFLKRS